MINKLVATGAADANDRKIVQLVVRLRASMRVACKNMNAMNNALQDFKNTHKLSNNKLQEVCKMAKICVCDGQWYPDLQKKLSSDVAFRMPKTHIKEYEHVRKLMLHASW